MNTGFYLRTSLRESRGAGGRLAFFVACLAVGVAAVVAVAGHAAAVEQAVRRDAKQLLAADVAVSGTLRLPEEVAAALASRPDLVVTTTRELVTVVAAPPRQGRPGPSLLVELKAVGKGYPFYGRVESEPAAARAELDRDSLLAEPELLRRLGLAVGDRLLVGGHPFRIAGTVLSEPDRGLNPFHLGPRVLLTEDGLDRAALESFGSRIVYRTLLLSTDPAAGAADRVADELRERLGTTSYRVETWAQAQPALRDGLHRVNRFLGLVALLSLLVAGVGVAQTTRAWLADRMQSIAVLRCLGLRPGEAVILYLGQAAGLGLLGSLVGSGLGLLLDWQLPRLAGGMLQLGELTVWQPEALLRGLGLGVGVSVLFCLPPVLAVRRVPPARVFRRDVEPSKPPLAARALLATVVALGIWLAAGVQAGSPTEGGLFTLGLAVAAAVLGLATLGLLRVTARLGGRLAWLTARHGLAGLARPGAATVGAVVALGLGVLMVLGMALVERSVTGAMLAELPTDAPSAFLIDIQPDQLPDLEALLAANGVESFESVPVVTARLRSVDGVPVEDLVAARGEGRAEGGRWALTREQRLTYMEELPPDNRLVAGRPWTDDGVAEVSVEQEFASDLGVGLGSKLTFDVQGTPIELTVTSLRSVEWRTFGINFFLVVEPGVLDDAPQNRVATISVPPSVEPEVQDRLAARFPNITMLRIRELLEKVGALIERMALGVRSLGIFTVLAGIVILAGTVSAASVRRSREVALLKTLGMTRRQVAATFATEYAAGGLVAGVVGAVGANVLAWAVLTRGMDLAWQPDLALSAATALVTALLAAATAVAAGWRALERRPLALLQGD